MSPLRLGWLLARRSWRGSLARTVSMALGMIAAGVVAAALAGLPAVFDGRNARHDATRTTADPLSALLVGGWDESVPGGTLRRVVVAGEGAPPPGVAALPAPGEVVWSPALAALARREPTVAARFPQRVVGTVADAGLTEPGELLAYVGVDGRTVPGLELSRFGASDGEPVTGTREVRTIVVVGAVFLALPAGAFLATSARLSARARDRRLAALRLLGLTKRQVRVVNAVETAVVAAVGALVGVACWGAAQGRLGRHGVGGFRWFAADAPPRPGLAAAVALGAAVVAGVVATVTANDAVDEPLAARRAAAARVRVAWRAVVLVVGAGLLLACYRRNRSDSVALALLLGGGTLTVVGAALVTPLVSTVIGAALGRRGRGSPARLLVARRLTHEPAAAGRVLAGVLVATFALGVAQGVIGAFRDAAVSRSTDAMRSVITTLPAERLATLPGLAMAVPNVAVDGGTAWVATCAELRALFAQAVPACVDGTRIELALDGQGPATPAPGTVVVPVAWPVGESQVITGLVVPPGTAGVTPTSQWFARVDPARAEDFAAALVAADPTGFAGNWPDDGALADMVVAVVVAGAVAAFALGLGAVVVATADRAIERRALDANLLAVGVPASLLRRVQLAATVLPVAGAVTVAALAGTCTGFIYRRVGDEAGSTAFPWWPTVVSSAAGLTGALAAGLLAAALMRSRPHLADLRTE